VSNRRLYLGIVAAALVVVGLLALWFPVYLSQYDHYGMQIACGRGFSADLSQAAGAGGNGLVAQCGTALLLRRLWAIPAVVFGWLVLAGLVAAWVHTKPSEEESSRFWELSGDST
jgi:preprotein translocase subunit SecG